MKLFFFVTVLLVSPLSLFCANKSYAIGIFDEKGNGENIQHKRITNNDYNGVCYSKIVIFGNYKKEDIEVKIGDSIGHFQSTLSIFNKQNIKIAEELTFKHYTISNGYFEIKINNKIFDTKVYIK